MSSRSLAAARARRAGEQAPPISGNRPITSIGSQSAFIQQTPPNSNVRLARAQGQQQYPRTQNKNNDNYDIKNQIKSQISNNENLTQNNLPFSKLSISDAIGLITLRLGRVEQWIIETQHEETNNSIDPSVINTFTNRIENLEKKHLNSPINGYTKDDIIQINNENIKEHLNKIDDCLLLKNDIIELKKTIDNLFIENSKKNETLFKLNRDVISLNDTLKTFMITYDNYIQDNNTRFSDYETALSELEKNIFNNEIIQEENIINDENIINQDNNPSNETEIKKEEDFLTLLKEDLSNINI